MRRVLLLLLLVSACTKTPESGTGLTIYTGRDKDEVAHVIDLFTQKFPQYKGNVNTITLGAQAALDRLRAEKVQSSGGISVGRNTAGTAAGRQ